MGILTNLINRESRARVDVADPRDPVLAQWFGGSPTAAGVTVTGETAMTVSAVYACVRVIAESLAQLPLFVYERMADGGKTKAVDTPLYTLLHDEPNSWQTSYEWREMMAGHVALRGNAYSEIVGTGTRGISELVPLHPDRVRPFWAPGDTIAYEYTPERGPKRIILQSEMLHVRGLGFDLLRGLNPVEYQRESIGLAMAASEHGSRTFANGTALSGVYQHPGKLGDTAYDRLKSELQAKHAGLANAGRTAILEEGMTFSALSMTNEDAQYLETRKFQVVDIARMFRVPPHMVQSLDAATFSNIEHQSLDFVVYTLGPWLSRFEQAMRRALLNEQEQRRLDIAFKVDGLLRGDVHSRYGAYATARQWGWMSVNDIRELEDLNPVEDGDIYLQPMNMIEAGTDPEPMPEGEDDGETNIQS